MREWADFTVQERGGRATVVVQGPLLVSTIGPLDRRLREVRDSVQYVDLENAGDIDTVGAWTVWRFADGHHAEILNASDQAERLIEAVRESASSAPIIPERPPLLTRVPEETGENVVAAFSSAI